MRGSSIGRLVRMLLPILLLTAQLLTPTTALGGSGDFPAPYRIFWKPTDVDLTTTEISAQNHAVYESFVWGKPFSNDLVGPPRTLPGFNTFEAEMRFRQLPGVSNTNHWCERAGPANSGPWSVMNNFPGTFYEDAFQHDDSSEDEFTWGFRSAVPAVGTTYFLSFHCEPKINASETNTFTWSTQIGHCHSSPICSAATTWSDETVALVPKRLSGEGSFNPNATLGGNAGFESGLGNWVHDNRGSGSATVCNNPNPYEGDCYLFLKPDDPSASMALRLNFTVAEANLAQAETYSEFIVRCPEAWNSNACAVRVKILGQDANGNPTAPEVVGPTRTIPRDDGSWDAARLELTGGNTEWPSNTRIWRFKLMVDPGDVVDVDYHQQWYGGIS